MLHSTRKLVAYNIRFSLFWAIFFFTLHSTRRLVAYSIRLSLFRV